MRSDGVESVIGQRMLGLFFGKSEGRRKTSSSVFPRRQTKSHIVVVVVVVEGSGRWLLELGYAHRCTSGLGAPANKSPRCFATNFADVVGAQVWTDARSFKTDLLPPDIVRRICDL